MSLNYEMARYTELTGEDGTKVSVSRLGGYLDGYNKGRTDTFDECIQLVKKYYNLPTVILVEGLEKLKGRTNE